MLPLPRPLRTQDSGHRRLRAAEESARRFGTAFRGVRLRGRLLPPLSLSDVCDRALRYRRSLLAILESCSSHAGTVHASPDLFVDVIIPCAMEMSACDSADCKATVLRIAGDSLSFLLNDLGDAAKDMLLQAASPASKIYTLVTRDVLPRVRALLADKEQVTLNSLRLLAKLVTENRSMPFPRCLYDMLFCPLILPLLTPGNAVCCTHLFAVVRQPLCPPPHLRLTRGTGARHRGVPGQDRKSVV